MRRLTRSRWWYRRTAWKNDPSLFMDMHPRLALWLDRAYVRSDPLRYAVSEFFRAAVIHAKVKAIRDVYGDNGRYEIKHWKYDGNAADIYTEARRRGWDG